MCGLTHNQHVLYIQVDITKYGITDEWNFSFMWSLRGKCKYQGNCITFCELFSENIVTTPKLKQLELKRQVQAAMGEINKQKQQQESRVVKTSEKTLAVMAQVRAEGRKRARVEPAGTPAQMRLVAPNMYVPPSIG